MKALYFDFRNTEPALYRTGGAGFVTEKNRREESEERLRIPELSSAFLPHFWLTDIDFSHLSYDERGVYLSSEAIAEKVALNGAAVPILYRADIDGAGNYRVTVTIDNTGGDDDDILIYITRRRLYYKGKLAKDEVFERSFIVNVCEFIPRGYKEEFSGTSLDVAVVGKKPRLTGLTIEKADGVPTVWVAGDSTLTDQSAAYPYCPSTSYSGWGQMLSAFLDGVAVSNHAHSGLTTHTFRCGGHHAIVMRHIGKGDYFLIQFAHNDQKVDFLTADGGYRERLVEYCAEVRAAGAHPVIVTPLARNSWRGDGQYNDLLFDYDRVCKEVGCELSVPVIGLHDFMMNKVKTEGLTLAKRYYYPGDYTHTNDPGAYMCAEYVAGELSKLDGDYAPLAASAFVSDEAWDAPSGAIPPSPPEGYKAAEVKTDTKIEDGNVTRAEAVDILIKAAHYFTVNVYNDMYKDVLGHEWYAGAVECAYQNGILPAELTVGGMFRPDEKITLGDFAVMASAAYVSRNSPPRETESPFDGKCELWREPYLKRAYAIGIINSDDELDSPVGRVRIYKMCEMMKL